MAITDPYRLIVARIVQFPNSLPSHQATKFVKWLVRCHTSVIRFQRCEPMDLLKTAISQIACGSEQYHLIPWGT